MSKIKIKVNKDEPAVVVNEAKPEPAVIVNEPKPEPVVVVNEPKPEPAPTVNEPLIYPEGKGIKKFHAVPFKDGFVVYNPDGSRVSNILTALQANDIVREQNQAAHIKG